MPSGTKLCFLVPSSQFPLFRINIFLNKFAGETKYFRNIVLLHMLNLEKLALITTEM